MRQRDTFWAASEDELYILTILSRYGDAADNLLFQPCLTLPRVRFHRALPSLPLDRFRHCSVLHSTHFFSLRRLAHVDCYVSVAPGLCRGATSASGVSVNEQL